LGHSVIRLGIWDYGGFMANECVFGELGISPFSVHDAVEVLTLFLGLWYWAGGLEFIDKGFFYVDKGFIKDGGNNGRWGSVVY
jgi:hypothetical protein